MDEELTRLDVPSTDPGTLGEAQATDRVNVRSGPGKGYAKLGQLRRGQRVAVWAIDGNWAQITGQAAARVCIFGLSAFNDELRIGVDERKPYVSWATISRIS